MMHSQSSPQNINWDTKPTSTPCWSIWAPCASEQQQHGFQALTPPKESKFWPIPRRPSAGSTGMYSPQSPPHSIHSHFYPQSPPLTPQQSPFAHGLQAVSSPTLSPSLHLDRSYMVQATMPLHLVKFKGDRLEVYQGYGFHENDLVIVEADRGQDLGRVHRAHVSADEAGQVKFWQHEERNAILLACGSKDPQTAPTASTPNQILRAASTEEAQQLSQKQSDELKAIAFCRQRVQERQLDMVVVDAEFQWDRRKLTFFYKAGHRIDFRDLVRELFRTYKTRIWMCAVAQ